jgi:hypothetical protein
MVSVTLNSLREQASKVLAKMRDVFIVQKEPGNCGMVKLSDRSCICHVAFYLKDKTKFGQFYFFLSNPYPFGQIVFHS